MSHGSPVELKIMSTPRCLAAVRGAVEEMARFEGFGDMDSHGLVLAIDEALANVIEHGYGGEEGHPIVVTLTPMSSSDGRRGVSVIVRDHGQQVRPEQICGRNLEDVRPGGLGVHIIRSVMDEVEYSCPIDGGMMLRMVKYASPAASTSGADIAPTGDVEQNS